jgi:hypothetical protein
MNTTHGNRTITDRRATTEAQIAFYLGQARLAAAGVITRKPAEFFLRQAEYFRTFGA